MPLFVVACCGGDLERAQALQWAGCNVAAVDSTGGTALICAASEGHAEVVGWLLTAEGGAARLLEARDKGGFTAFLAACINGQLECAKVLHRAECDVTARKTRVDGFPPRSGKELAHAERGS